MIDEADPTQEGWAVDIFRELGDAWARMTPERTAELAAQLGVRI